MGWLFCKCAGCIASVLAVVHVGWLFCEWAGSLQVSWLFDTMAGCFASGVSVLQVKWLLCKLDWLFYKWADSPASGLADIQVC